MTARSPHVGVVELEPSLYRRTDDPLCAQRVRDGVVNGVLHKADSVAQVRINWQPVREDVPVTGSPRRWATGRDELMAATDAGEWYLLEASPFGVIDVPRFGSGELYEFRVRTAWGASAPDFADPPPAADINVRVFLYPWGSDPRDEHPRAVDHVWQADFAAAGVGYLGAWVSGATRGDGAYATKLVLDREGTDWPNVEVTTPNAPAGGDAEVTEVVRVGLGVAASVSLDPNSQGATVIPLMRALHVQGFVGVADG